MLKNLMIKLLPGIFVGVLALTGAATAWAEEATSTRPSFEEINEGKKMILQTTNPKSEKPASSSNAKKSGETATETQGQSK